MLGLQHYTLLSKITSAVTPTVRVGWASDQAALPSSFKLDFPLKVTL